MKKILFIHENYPAQFGALAKYMADIGWEVMFATAAKGIEQDQVKRDGKIRIAGYRAHREPHSSTHNYLQGTEKAILNGQGFARLAIKLRNSGFSPDVVMAHSGWGSGTFTKAVWPEAKFIQYLEWWYEHPARDTMFTPSEKNVENQKARIFSRNLPFLLDWAYADGVIVPTKFQADGVPEKMRHNFLVMHDGVDTDMFSPPKGNVDLSFLDNPPPDDATVLTYATRGMEPYRGFPQFMQALSYLQKTHKDFHCIIGGTDTIHYGPKLKDGDTWKKRMLAQWDFDMDRIHFTGRLPYHQYRNVLQRSNGHVYLTVPFVLSWSLVESMAIGCPIITNDCAPTREALPTDDSAIFVDFQDAKSVLKGMTYALDNQKDAAQKGEVSRKLALANYSQADLYPKKVAYVESILDQ